MNVEIELRLPTASEFLKLRGETNWGVPSATTAETLLKRSFSGAVAIEDGAVIGMVRTVGDGCLILYIQDMIISASHRSLAIGSTLIKTLLTETEKTILPSCTIGLFAATDQDGFYKKMGFSPRNPPNYGPGMQAKFSDLTHFQRNIYSAAQKIGK